jgi:hypothetical protein
MVRLLLLTSRINVAKKDNLFRKRARSSVTYLVYEEIDRRISSEARLQFAGAHSTPQLLKLKINL